MAAALAASPARAQFVPQATAAPGSAPQGINYQGRLEDDGFPVTGTRQMVFRVFDALTGGAALWTSPAQTVSVSIGLFNAVVPVPITALVGGGSRYLEVEIDGTLMSPRELLNSVPYALIAKSVEGTIDVSTAGLSINANPSATQPSLHVSSQTGYVGVGTGDPSAAFDVGGNAQFGSGASKSTFTATGDARIAFGVYAGSATFTAGVTASSATLTGGASIGGSLGVGTSNPAATLDVVGSAQFGSGAAKSTFTAAGSLLVPGNVGLGTASPASRFHLSSGTIIVDGNATDALTTTGNVGIGTPSPSARLHVASAGNTSQVIQTTTLGNSSNIGLVNPGRMWSLNVRGDLANDPFSVRDETAGSVNRLVIDSAGRTGIGTDAPAARLDVEGDAQFGSGAAKSTFTAAGSLLMAGNVGLGTSNPAATLDVVGNAQFGSGAAKSTFTAAGSLLVPGNVGIGPAVTSAKLSLTATGGELGGTAASTALRTNAGALGTAAGNTLKLASIGFTAANNSSLGIEALRTADGADWTTTAIGLKMDVDNTSPVGNAQIWLKTDGNIGVGTLSPETTLDVEGDAQFGSGAAKSTFTATGDILVPGTAVVGPATPEGLLRLYGDGPMYYDRANAAGSPHIVLRKANGTTANPTDALSGDTLGRLSFLGYAAGAFPSGVSGSGMAAVATENWTATARGTALQHFTTPNGTTAPAERMRINENGYIGIGTASPDSTLQVVGNYMHIPSISGSNPLAADCDAAGEGGRLVVKTDGGAGQRLWVCLGTGGWVSF